MGFPDGYCTHGCSTDRDCAGDDKCITTVSGPFCYAACTFDGDCRQQYLCEAAGARAGTCYKHCTSDSQCRTEAVGWENIVCELATGRCIDTTPEPEPEPEPEVEPDVGPSEDVATGDDTSVADAGDELDADPPTFTDPPKSTGGSDDGCGCRSARTTVSPGPVTLSLGALLVLLLAIRRR
jgi:hypothetical protein